MQLNAPAEPGALQCKASAALHHLCGFDAAKQLKRMQSSGPAAQQFLAEVSRILTEGTARQETSQEMTGKIAHAASVTNLPSLGSHPNSGKHPALPQCECASRLSLLSVT